MKKNTSDHMNLQPLPMIASAPVFILSSLGGVITLALMLFFVKLFIFGAKLRSM